MIHQPPFTLHTGHALAVLMGMPDRSVQACVTSPPYYRLRSYNLPPAAWPDGWNGELGQEDTPEQYVEHLGAVATEVYRVLRDDGSLWLNIADTWGKDGSLLGVPWLVAQRLRQIGFRVRSEVVWSKAGGNCPRCHHRIERGSSRPEAATDRFSAAHEQVFLCAKGKGYYFDREAIKHPSSPALRRDVLHLPRASYRDAHYAVMPTDLARIAVLGGTSAHGCCAWCRKPYVRRLEVGEPLLDWQRKAGGDSEGEYAGESGKDYDAHGGQDPSDMKRRVLASMRARRTVGWDRTCDCDTDSVVPCTVLDPFSGAGTTGVAALELGRHYVGIEIRDADNESLARPRLEAALANPRPAVDKTVVVESAPLPAESAVYEGDALTIMPRLPAGCAAMIMGDPPYNVSRKNNFKTMKRTGIDFEWDGDFDQIAWLAEADRLLRPGGAFIVWGDWKLLGAIASALQELDYDVKRNITYIKSNPWPRNVDRSPVQRTELGLWAVKPGAPWVFNRRPGFPYEDFVFRAPLPRAAGKGRPRHPAKKPDSIYHTLISVLTNPGDLVVDPFAGGGTTAYVAEVCGRRHISIDLGTEWITETNLRWSEAKKRLITEASDGACSLPHAATAPAPNPRS